MPIDLSRIVPDRARVRCCKFITSTTPLARSLVTAKLECVQSDRLKFFSRSHSLGVCNGNDPVKIIRKSPSVPSISAARTSLIAVIIFFAAHFVASGRRHHAGQIRFRRSALRAGGAANARTCDAAADAQSDASAARKATDRALDLELRRQSAGLALSGRAVRRARGGCDLSLRVWRCSQRKDLQSPRP